MGEAKFRLNGLDCASCAVNIETALKKSSLFGEVTVNFATETLALSRGRLDEAQRIIDKVEPGVKLVATANAAATAADRAASASAPAPDEPRRFENAFRIASIAAAGVLMAVGIALNSPLHDTPFAFAEYAVLISAYLLVGWKVLLSAIRNILKGNLFNENTLMSIATIGAVVIHELPEAVGVMLFFYVGEYFQDMAVGRSRRSIRALMDVRPEYANLNGENGLERVSPESVRPGSVITVKPGERIPLDGVILDGSSFVDTSALTGESAPRSVAPGDDVLAGTVNAGGLLTVRVTREFGESSVSKVLELVENAASRKAPTEQFITRFARLYTPLVVLAATLVAFVPPLVLPGAVLSEWVYRALILLVISCPCALVISIPLGYFGGIGAASRRGVLVKGANYLEALTKTTAVVFDKTGTLTEGVFSVSETAGLAGFTPEEVLEYAAHAESQSTHPIAQSIMRAFTGVVRDADVTDYREIPGHGTCVTFRNRRVLAGNDRLLHREKIPHDNCNSDSTVVYVAVDGVLAGFIKVADTIKQDAEETVRAIHALGIKRTVMLTGDEPSVAEKIAAESGIDEYYANMLPEQKVSKVEELIASEADAGGKLLFVGDGINDAPVISRADVGVAMGGMGSDAAVEAADVVIMDDRPSRLIDAFAVAGFTKRIVWQNIVLAMLVKAVFVALGTVGAATMWQAVFADVGVALLAVLNSIRVLRFAPAAPGRRSATKRDRPAVHLDSES